MSRKAVPDYPGHVSCIMKCITQRLLEKEDYRLLNELQGRKGDLKDKSEEYKNKRNEFNLEASKCATKRNELNKRTKELIEEAQQLKKLRDENNEQVAQSKLKRDELNDQANKIYAEIDKIRKGLNLGDGPSLKELKKQMMRWNSSSRLR